MTVQCPLARDHSASQKAAMCQEREDYADSQVPPPTRVGCWLFAVAIGTGTGLGVLLLAVVISRAIPVTSGGGTGNSRDDFAELMRALEIRMCMVAGAALFAGTIAGVVAFRRKVR